MSTLPASPDKRWHFWIFLGFVLVLSYLTYFHQYWQPPNVFWDENYHIASAQKYLHGTYFMEQHPPLGKLLIAAGEYMFHPNADTSQFLGTDYGNDFRDGFSFVGYRFFPALLGWLSAPLLFLCFYLITRKNPLTACLLSFLYIFDNALVVHSRGAMLEGTLMFGAILTILAFLLILDHKPPAQGKKTDYRFLGLSAMFGAALGMVLTTKVLGLILILLIPVILVRLYPRWQRMLQFAGAFLVPFLLVYCGVWYTHFSLARTVNPVLPDAGYYQASEQYKSILNAGTTSSPLSFPVMLRDSLAFVAHYNAGTPRLDLCKEDENGSPFFFWPLGARSINYRWSTPDGSVYQYLTLQANPMVWWSVLLGVLLAGAMAVSALLFPPKVPMKRPLLLLTFLGLYVAFMLSVSQISRVMYLYHYFLPLMFGMLLLACVLEELQTFGRWKVTEPRRLWITIALGTLVFLGFQFYRPLTYYEPLTDAQFQLRNVLPLWDLKCVNCERKSPLVVPNKP